jgi:hypothetical protein
MSVRHNLISDSLNLLLLLVSWLIYDRLLYFKRILPPWNSSRKQKRSTLVKIKGRNFRETRGRTWGVFRSVEKLCVRIIGTDDDGCCISILWDRSCVRILPPALIRHSRYKSEIMDGRTDISNLKRKKSRQWRKVHLCTCKATIPSEWFPLPLAGRENRHETGTRYRHFGQTRRSLFFFFFLAQLHEARAAVAEVSYNAIKTPSAGRCSYCVRWHVRKEEEKTRSQ